MKCIFPRKHSRCLSFISPLRIAAAVLAIGLLLPSLASAQMFSVQEDNRTFQLPSSSLYIGMEWADFVYTGREGEFGQRDYEFSGPLIRVELETPNINLYMGTGGNMTGLENTTYFQAGIKGRYRFILIDEESFTLRVPIQLRSDITTVTNTALLNINSQFQQGTLLFGIGLHLEVRPTDAFRIEFSGIPQTGISFSSGGTFGGNMRALELGSHVFFDNAFGSIGLTGGYSYKFRGYDIDGSRYDYDLLGHTAKIGITF